MGRLQNNPSIGWVHPKSTHACLLAWGNKKTYTQTYNLIHSANFSFFSPYTPWEGVPTTPLQDKANKWEKMGGGEPHIPNPKHFKPSQIAFRGAHVPSQILPSPHFSKTDQ